MLPAGRFPLAAVTYDGSMTSSSSGSWAASSSQQYYVRSAPAVDDGLDSWQKGLLILCSFAVALACVAWQCRRSRRGARGGGAKAGGIQTAKLDQVPGYPQQTDKKGNTLFPQALPSGTSLPAGWIELKDPRSGRRFYHHQPTKHSTWDPISVRELAQQDAMLARRNGHAAAEQRPPQSLSPPTANRPGSGEAGGDPGSSTATSGAQLQGRGRALKELPMHKKPQAGSNHSGSLGVGEEFQVLERAAAEDGGADWLQVRAHGRQKKKHAQGWVRERLGQDLEAAVGGAGSGGAGEGAVAPPPRPEDAAMANPLADGAMKGSGAADWV
jgi:hypothetical protein